MGRLWREVASMIFLRGSIIKNMNYNDTLRYLMETCHLSTPCIKAIVIAQTLRRTNSLERI